MLIGKLEVCPKCLAKAQAKYDKAKAKLAETYGSIPPEEYVEASNDLPRLEPLGILDATLKIKHDVNIKDGLLNISVAAKCAKCNFSVTKEISESVSEEIS